MQSVKMEQQCWDQWADIYWRDTKREDLAPIQQVWMNGAERDGTLSLMCVAECGRQCEECVYACVNLFTYAYAVCVCIHVINIMTVYIILLCTSINFME